MTIFSQDWFGEALFIVWWWSHGRLHPSRFKSWCPYMWLYTSLVGASRKYYFYCLKKSSGLVYFDGTLYNVFFFALVLKYVFMLIRSGTNKWLFRHMLFKTVRLFEQLWFTVLLLFYFIDLDGTLLAWWCFSHYGHIFREYWIGIKNFQAKRVYV